MQLLYSSTIPVVEFASVSLLLKDSAEMGESIVTASPLSTTPFSSLALVELHEYLLTLHAATSEDVANAGGKTTGLPSSSPLLACVDQLAKDDARLIENERPQVYRSSKSGIALYYCLVKETQVMHQSFVALMTSDAGTRLSVDKIAGVVLCVGVSGHFSAQASSMLVRSISTRMQDVVLLMRRMAGDAEECKNCYKALLSTLLLTDDDERKTNAMVNAEQITMTLDIESPDDKQSHGKFGIKKQRSLGTIQKRSLAAEQLTTTLESISSADMARLMEKRAAVLSVSEKDCALRKYELTGKGKKNKDEDKGRLPRRRKTKSDEVFKDFDYRSPADVQAVAEQPVVHTTFVKQPSFKSPLASPPGKPAPKPLLAPPPGALKPPRSAPVSKKRPSTKARQLTPPQVPAQQRPQKAFDVFDVTDSEDSGDAFAGTIPFPGLDSDDSMGDKKSSKGGTPSFDPFDRSDHSGSTAPTMAFSDDSSIGHGKLGVDDGSSRIQINVALNEDLTCSYKQSKVSSCSIEGVVQVQVKSSAKEGSPFFLLIRDPSRHIRMIQENRRYADDLSDKLSDDNEEDVGLDYKFTISVPKAQNYFPVMRYKCSPELRPVPIRVQTRVRISRPYCRVALQISSNPANEDDLTDLTIIMGVPAEVKGESLTTSPPGGVWNAAKRSVVWCVAELGDGEKFQLQAQFEIEKDHISQAEQEKPRFPVLVRCQCMYAQLSDIELEVTDVPDVFPAEVTMKLARRFRLSHRERS